MAGGRRALAADAPTTILEKGRRHRLLDGKGNVRPDKLQKECELSQSPIRLEPSGLVRRLAQEIITDKPEVTFDIMALHRACWTLLEALHREYLALCGPSFAKFVPQEDKLPFVVGYTFSTVAGRRGVYEKDKDQPQDYLIRAAGATVTKFLDDGHGRVVKDRAGRRVKPEEVEGLTYKDPHPFESQKIVAKVAKEMRRRA